MLDALLNGKLARELENMEDVLTSNVFGLTKYLPAKEALLPFLRQARDTIGDAPLSDISDDAAAEYEFWPSWHEPGCVFCEPDLALRIDDKDATYLVGIEAKYRSGKSSFADPADVPSEPHSANDQLAKEWQNLCRIAEREGRKPVLVYLTADYGVPRQEILESQADLMKSGCICWLSWRHLLRVVEMRETAIGKDLTALMHRLGFTFFNTSWVVPEINVQWRYTRALRRFEHIADPEPVNITWSYAR